MSETDVKLQKLKELGKKRQQAPPGKEYKRIADFCEQKYESDFVSPYSKSSSNVNSEIMLLLQDWASSDKLSQPFNEQFAVLGYDTDLDINQNLIVLLQETFGLKLNEVFTTNVFPFIKHGGMSTPIPQADITEPYKKFCYPQIEIIKPKLVICCGKQAYVASLKYSRESTKNLMSVRNNFHVEDMLFYHQRVPSYYGISHNFKRGGIEGAKSDWLAMKDEFRQFKLKVKD